MPDRCRWYGCCLAQYASAASRDAMCRRCGEPLESSWGRLVRWVRRRWWRMVVRDG